MCAFFLVIPCLVVAVQPCMGWIPIKKKPNWESTQLTSIGKGLLNGAYKVWLMPCCQNVASLSIFYRYYFSRCSSELAELVPLPYFWGRSTHYSNRLHDFSVTMILDVAKMSKSAVSFFAQLDSGILYL